MGSGWRRCRTRGGAWRGGGGRAWRGEGGGWLGLQLSRVCVCVGGGVRGACLPRVGATTSRGMQIARAWACAITHAYSRARGPVPVPVGLCPCLRLRLIMFLCLYLFLCVYLFLCRHRLRLYSFGNNRRGQLGLGNLRSRAAPQPIIPLCGRGIDTVCLVRTTPRARVCVGVGTVLLRQCQL